MFVMAIKFYTDDSENLLRLFEARISQEEEKGKIKTWDIIGEKTYTHSSPEWKRKAKFVAKAESDNLTFGIKPLDVDPLTIPVYGYYHGHLMQTFLDHFDKDFDLVGTTALLSSDDVS